MNLTGAPSYVLGTIEGQQVCLRTLEGYPVAPPLKAKNCLLISRADCMVLSLEAPRHGPLKLDAYVSREVKGLYPGVVESVVWDYHSGPGRTVWPTLVCIIEKSSLDLYRAVAGKAELTTVSALLSSCHRAGASTPLDWAQAVYSGRGYQEIILREAQHPLSSSVVLASSSPSIAEQTRSRLVAADSPAMVKLFFPVTPTQCDRGPAPSGTVLGEGKETRSSNGWIEVPLAEVLPSRPARCCLFNSPGPLERFMEAGGRLLFCACLIAAASVALMILSAGRRAEPYRPPFVAALQNETVRKPNQGNYETTPFSRVDMGDNPGTPQDVYELLQGLREALNDDEYIRNLDATGDEFQITCSSQRPFELLQRIARIDRLTDIRLVQCSDPGTSQLPILTVRGRLQ